MSPISFRLASSTMRTRFEFRARSEISRTAWDDFVDGCDEAWLWHRSDLIEIRTAFPGVQDRSFGAFDAQGKLVAVVPLHLLAIRIRRLITYRSLLSEGGPVCANAISAGARRALMNELQTYLKREMHALDAERVEARVPPLAPHLHGAHAPRANPLLQAGFEDWTSAVWMIDLTPPPQEIRRRYSEGTRQEIREAQRIGFNLREASAEGDLDIFYGLHRETFLRTGLVPDPRGYYEAIFQCLMPRRMARINFLERDGRVVAANISVLYKHGAYYWMNASSSDASGGANRLLFDDQLMAARARGCIRYEAGKAYLAGDNAKEKGISYFKGSFGSELVTRHGGRMISPRRKFQLFWAAQKLVQAVRG